MLHRQEAKIKQMWVKDETRRPAEKSTSKTTKVIMNFPCGPTAPFGCLSTDRSKEQIFLYPKVRLPLVHALDMNIWI